MHPLTKIIMNDAEETNEKIEDVLDRFFTAFQCEHMYEIERKQTKKERLKYGKMPTR